MKNAPKYVNGYFAAARTADFKIAFSENQLPQFESMKQSYSHLKSEENEQCG